jgi:hypothetical protein
MRYLIVTFSFLIFTSTAFAQQVSNPFAEGYIQDTNPFAEGYVQNTNPFAEGYVQDKDVFGLDLEE